ncbi:MAG: MATE family efflux transporter [Dysosmobacter sp.]
MAGAGVLYLVLAEAFLMPLLQVFGATGEVIPFARQYSEIVLLGMPFLILTNGISNLIRADGSPRYSMLCMVAGAIVNTILDPVFIFGLGWGVFGAALATILGQFLSFILALRYLWHFRTIELTKACFRLRPRDNLRTLYMGISSCINQVAITLVQIVLNNSLTYYGARSIYGEAYPSAACGIVMKTNAILLSIIVGISQGVQPIIGFNYGAGKYDRVRQAYLLAIRWNFVVSAVGFCLFQFFPAPIISLFGDGEPLYFEFAILFMRTFLFMVLVNGVQLLSSNFFTAIGKALKGLLLSLTRQVFFLIPLIFLLPLRFGIFGVLLAGPIADFIAFVVSVILVSREFKVLSRQQHKC